jgi:hypothetical protein
MDEIALLCNLHADGPASLKVLRRAGVRTLSQVSEFDLPRLADTLGVSPSFARRFAREARLLAGRMNGEGFEAEEAATTATPAEPPTPPEVRPAPVEIARERTAPATQASRPAIVPSTGTRLVSFIIPGLDRQSCDRLVAQGIRTLEELAVAPGLALARRIEMPLPRLLDLQYLAQQRIAAPARTAPADDALESEYVLQPTPRLSRMALPPADTVWRPDIGHLQPPLHVPHHADSEVAGPFA